MGLSCDCATRLPVSENCVSAFEFYGCDCGNSTGSKERKYPQKSAHICKGARTEDMFFSEFTR